MTVLKQNISYVVENASSDFGEENGIIEAIFYDCVQVL